MSALLGVASRAPFTSSATRLTSFRLRSVSLVFFITMGKSPKRSTAKAAITPSQNGLSLIFFISTFMAVSLLGRGGGSRRGLPSLFADREIQRYLVAPVVQRSVIVRLHEAVVLGFRPLELGVFLLHGVAQGG